jgi:hypothetical protein
MTRLNQLEGLAQVRQDGDSWTKFLVSSDHVSWRIRFVALVKAYLGNGHKCLANRGQDLLQQIRLMTVTMNWPARCIHNIRTEIYACCRQMGSVYTYVDQLPEPPLRQLNANH